MSSILQDIFSDYYEEMIYTLHPRQTVIKNVDKMLHCGDPSYGGAMFGCPHCGNLKFVPFRCKSRCMFSKMNKSENFTPGLICVLHTFGRDLKWNPHIHTLISEGGAGNITPWRPVKHFDYNFLRNAFRKVLLEQLTALVHLFAKLKTKYIPNMQTVFTFVLNPTSALLISPLNTSADISADL